MSDEWVQSGAVFQWAHSQSPSRVLLRDGETLMYDAWWPHLADWGMADLSAVRRKRYHYYVAGVSWLPGKAVQIGAAPLSEEEWATHRPDLPFVIARSATTRWTDPVVPDAEATAVLTVPVLYVCAFGPKGGMKAPVKLSADDGYGFTVGEVMRKAAAVQAPHLGRFLPGDGIGIYRLGLQRGIACYYLWGATPQHESVT